MTEPNHAGPSTVAGVLPEMDNQQSERGAWKTISPNIQRLPNGKYRVRLATAAGRKTLGTYSTAEEAVRMRDAALAELVAGNMAAVGGVTLRAWMEEFLRRREASGLRNAKIDRHRATKHILSSFFADWPLRAIERRHVERFKRELALKKVDEEGRRRGRRLQ